MAEKRGQGLSIKKYNRQLMQLDTRTNENARKSKIEDDGFNDFFNGKASESRSTTTNKMSVDEAMEFLGFKDISYLTEASIKKQYRIKSLEYHPDKHDKEIEADPNFGNPTKKNETEEKYKTLFNQAAEARFVFDIYRHIVCNVFIKISVIAGQSINFFIIFFIFNMIYFLKK